MQILSALMSGEHLTSSAWAVKTRSTKLTSRISELREKGVKIDSYWDDKVKQNVYWIPAATWLEIKLDAFEEEELNPVARAKTGA